MLSYSIGWASFLDCSFGGLADAKWASVCALCAAPASFVTLHGLVFNT